MLGIRIQLFNFNISFHFCISGDTPEVEKPEVKGSLSLEPASVEKISLRHSYSEIGDLLYEGSVYLDGRPVCDNSWDQEEALVVCRWEDFRNPNPALPPLQDVWLQSGCGSCSIALFPR